MHTVPRVRIRISELIDKLEYNHLNPNPRTYNRKVAVEPKNKRRINLIKYDGVKTKEMKCVSGRLYGLDCASRSYKFAQENRPPGMYTLDRMEYTENLIRSEVTNHPVLKKAALILAAYESGKQVCDTSEVWTYGQTLIVVYTLEVYKFLQHVQHLKQHFFHSPTIRVEKVKKNRKKEYRLPPTN